MSNKKIIALIPAAGKGKRLMADKPKQFLPLMGKTVLGWSLDAFKNHPMISDVVAVDGEKIAGGATRQESVLNGLEYIEQNGGADGVLVHDAARPCLSPDLITRVCETLLSGAQAVVPAMPVTDTLRRKTTAGTETENRENLFAVQTPQGFSFGALLALHRKYKTEHVTDDAALFEKAGQKITMIDGEADNIKITYPADFSRAASILAAQRLDMRTGTGFDVHKLIPATANRPLKIGGICIPHDKTLDGHSDADVALHAITDALLGCLSDGDIGLHFSPKDERWKNADSATFLRNAADLVTARSGMISHIDVTVICEEPKIGPYRDAMRQRIAGILTLDPGRISIKATTTEGLGFTGRREGIAAEAIATVRLPFQFTDMKAA